MIEGEWATRPFWANFHIPDPPRLGGELQAGLWLASWKGREGAGGRTAEPPSWAAQVAAYTLTLCLGPPTPARQQPATPMPGSSPADGQSTSSSPPPSLPLPPGVCTQLSRCKLCGLGQRAILLCADHASPRIAGAGKPLAELLLLILPAACPSSPYPPFPAVDRHTVGAHPPG